MKTILHYLLFAVLFGLSIFSSNSTAYSQIQVDADGVGASGIGFLTKVGNQMFYYGTNETNTSQIGLFTHDGVTPTFVKQLSTNTQIPNIKTIHDGYGKAYFHFNSNSSTTMDGLVVSDGTEVGTIQIFSCKAPYWYANCNGKVFFEAKLGTINDRELYVTDGTVAGTFMVKDIYPGSTGSQPNGGVEFNNEFWFRALSNTSSGYQLYRSDGTEAGTTQFVYPATLTGRVDDLYVHNGYLYFVGRTTSNVDALWRTDGTTAGTVKIFEGNNSIGTFGIINSIGNTLLGFSTNINVFPNVYSLYSIDAVTLDTSLLKVGVLNAGGEKGWIYDNKMIFVGSTAAAGLEPWITDGTAAGTFMLADITTGTTSTNIYRSVAYSNNELYLNTQSSGIWKTDGTEAGTLALGIQPDNNYNTSFLSLNNEVYFLMDSPGRLRKIHKLGTTTTIMSSLEQDKISVYPNPAYDIIQISVDDYTASSVAIYAINGQLMHSVNLTSHQTQVDISTMDAGLYFVYIKNNNGYSVTKIVKN